MIIPDVYLTTILSNLTLTMARRRDTLTYGEKISKLVIIVGREGQSLFDNDRYAANKWPCD
jgi:hypothetical protein